MSVEAPRPLRADARRNHQAIVAAARAAFAAEGPEVSLEEVARRAGVGPSTLYRRFSGREELLRAVLDDLLTERIEPLLALAVRNEDPWAALVAVLEELVEGVAAHRALFRAAKVAGVLGPTAGARVLGPLGELVRRGQRAGVVRADLEAADLPRIVLMAVVTTGPWDGAPSTGRAPQAPSPADTRQWPRYLALLLDGLRPSPHPLPPRADRCS